MAGDLLWTGADGAGPSTYLLAGIGLGLLLGGMVLGWLFREGWRKAEYRMAQRVAGMVQDILTTQAAEHAPNPAQQRDVAEQALADFARMRNQLETLSARYEHVALGGQVDDPPATFKTVRKDKK